MPADHGLGLLEALRRLFDKRADLLGARLQPVLPDDLIQDQAESDALLGLGTEDLRGQVELLGLDAAVLELGDRPLSQTLRLELDQRLRNDELARGEQRPHHLLLERALDLAS